MGIIKYFQNLVENQIDKRNLCHKKKPAESNLPFSLLCLKGEFKSMSKVRFYNWYLANAAFHSEGIILSLKPVPIDKLVLYRFD